MPLPPIGVLSVTCPRCRRGPGHPCVNRRGYFHDHAERRTAWLAAEAAEHAATRAPA